MKVVVSEFVTLDGVMQAPGGAGPDLDRGGWNIPYMDEEAIKYKTDELLAADALLLGGVTYRVFAASWPNIDMGVMSDQMNGLKKYAVSSTLKPEELTWNNSERITGDVIAEIKKLKQAPGKDILVYGSGTLVQTLIQNDLVDEYRLMVHPVILGKGKPLFQDGLDQKTLKLVEVKATPSGLAILTYVSKSE